MISFLEAAGARQTNHPRPTARSFTPTFPAYPSGHATFGAATFQVARQYLQSFAKANVAANGSDDIAVEFVSGELNGIAAYTDGAVRPRHLRQFSGVPLGLSIANHLLAQAAASILAPSPASVLPPAFDATP